MTFVNVIPEHQAETDVPLTTRLSRETAEVTLSESTIEPLFAGNDHATEFRRLRCARSGDSIECPH